MLCLNHKVPSTPNGLMFSLDLCLCLAANLPILIALMGRVVELQFQVVFFKLNLARVDLVRC